MGVSAVEVKVPMVSDVPAEVSEDGYNSQIVRKYERSSRQTRDLFRKLYMEGLSTGDFEPVFRELVGETTALSANAIVRLKSRWEFRVPVVAIKSSRRVWLRLHMGRWSVPGGRWRSGEDSSVVRGGSEGGR